MSYGVRQALLIAVGAVVLASIAGVLARRQALTLRYAVGWLSIGVIAMVGALATPLLEPIGEFFGMTPTGLLLALATVVLLAITLQLSISVSGLQQQLRDVGEAVALAELREQTRQSGDSAR